MKTLVVFTTFIIFFTTTVSSQEVDNSKVRLKYPYDFSVVEVQPEFPGGAEALLGYIGNNINYPLDAIEEGAGGTVFVSFVIEENGSVSNVSIVRGVHPSIDEEAIRVVNQMPNWKPGYHEGEAVRVQFIMPIRFSTY